MQNEKDLTDKNLDNRLNCTSTTYPLDHSPITLISNDLSSAEWIQSSSKETPCVFLSIVSKLIT